LSADYGSGAGTFHIHDITIVGGGSEVYARNSVLSNIQDSTVGGSSNVNINMILLDNPFMDSIRAVESGGGGGSGASNGISINGGMHTTVEMQDKGGGTNGYRSWGTDHALFASRYEVQLNAGVDIGRDSGGAVQPSVGTSVAGIEEEANVTGIRLSKCQNCSVSAANILGHEQALWNGSTYTYAPDYYGLYVDDAHNTTFSGMEASGFFWTAALALTSKASSDTFIDVFGENKCGSSSPCTSTNWTTWSVDPGATGLTFLATNKP
jgi:hypothetical protein